MPDADARKVLRMWDAARGSQEASSFQVDVTPSDLLNLHDTHLGPALREVDRQWPQGRRRGNRIGTIETYFDHAGVLHMHFRERGEYVQREGALADVPVGNLSSYNLGPVFNEADSGAATVGGLIVSLPKDVDPNDPRWGQIAALLSEMGNP